MILSGLELGNRLIKALGIDPSRRITKIVIEADVRDKARVTICEVVDEQGANGVVETVRDYVLAERADDGDSG